MAIDSNLLVFLSLALAFIICYTSIPSIVRVANAKSLYDEPGKRKLHKKSVPTLGGIAIFSAVIIATGVFTQYKFNPEFQYLTIGSIVLFFVGLKDDILVIAPMKKLLGQLFAIAIIIVLSDLRFTSLHGFLGVHKLLYWHSIILSLFVFIVIINGFNLIDGIDGLASGVGMVASLAFGTFFYLAGEFEYAILAAGLTGSLIAFFWFNVFGKDYKIFMGDTGSLIVGLFLAVMAVRFNEMNVSPDKCSIFIHAAPAVSFGILIVPLFDTMRVFLIRILKGHSPFRADKNHVHHKLLGLGLSHLQATMYILFVNCIFIAMVFYLNTWGIIDLMVLNIALAIVISILPEYIFKRKAGKPQ
jgi:UDP-N-acetylmuramyl pentapeptide phosphotransferase/UDP-N-acetylglucosamine-1-phosphate transferase